VTGRPLLPSGVAPGARLAPAPRHPNQRLHRLGQNAPQVDRRPLPVRAEARPDVRASPRGPRASTSRSEDVGPSRGRRRDEPRRAGSPGDPDGRDPGPRPGGEDRRDPPERGRAGKADKAKGAQTAAGKARAALSKTSRAEAAAETATKPAAKTTAKATATKPAAKKATTSKK
jgi:hypothetical protein